MTVQSAPIKVSEFEPELAEVLPETHALLKAANLIVHPAVTRITLEGSRGLAGRYRPDSDIDLTLIVDTDTLPESTRQRGDFLRDVLNTTLKVWQGRIEVDLAAVFDIHGCGLPCLGKTYYEEGACPCGGVDSFGLYKIQKGFNGFVQGTGIIQIKRMYPILTIWRNQP
jgi:predicted nucleotidyltransferase